MEEELQPQFVPDESQQRVINVSGGYHLVLAPPGCGKTQILTERIRQAHIDGVDYHDMICLTFTNRASRGMAERIHSHLGDEGVGDIYVGNVHRFCSHFLYENNLVAMETSVIDDADAISILARYLNEDEYAVSENPNRRRVYEEVIHFSSLMHQIRHGHGKRLRLHPECVNAEDVMAMRNLCALQRVTFDARAMTDIYDHVDFYRDVSHSDAINYGTRQMIGRLLRKMSLAHQYADYKQQNKLMDFEDLLLLTYDALYADADHQYRRYPWIQVDEVQDLNPLQLHIVDLITAPEATVLYLGDEQQAIFSFMGAKMDMLTLLRQRCEGHIHHLTVNHRSPDYLLQVFNTYASSVLHIAVDLLPVSGEHPVRVGNELQIMQSSTYDTEVRDVVQKVRWLYDANPEETTAIIVSANRDADMVSDALKEAHLQHFKVSGVDIFSTPEMKMLFAHLNILTNEHQFMSWSRLLTGLHVFETNAAARNFMRALLDRAMLPSDFLLYDQSTYVQDFARVYEQDEMVIFDTETTGLNVFEDDILQIAAVKVRQGKVVSGSEFKIFIATDREIPQMLGDIENPIVDEMKQNPLHEHREALHLFLDYVGGDVLLGHNADYDYHILDGNLRRYLPEADLHKCCPRYFDSLKLMKLLEPGLKEYKLKFLLAELHLEGANTHLADADVAATRSVVVHCYQKAKEIIGSQLELMRQQKVKDRVATLRQYYREQYFQAREQLYIRDRRPECPALIGCLSVFYQSLLHNGLIPELERFDYVVKYLMFDMLKEDTEPSLIEQLAHHIMEMNTLKEADLCNSHFIADRIFVSTVHKAKGLEFDNVIIFDAVEGRYPNYYNQSNPALLAEDARKFYVAMSRAKRRLYVAQSQMRIDIHRQPQPRQLTRFMTPVMQFFN